MFGSVRACCQAMPQADVRDLRARPGRGWLKPYCEWLRVAGAGAVCSCETAFAPDRELRDATRCAPRSAGAAGRAVTCCSFLGPLQGSPSCRHLDHCSFCFACDSVPSFAKLALVAGKLQPNYRQRCWWNLPPAACVPPIQNWRPAPAPELFAKVMRLTHD